jgi:hypothetical protein
VIDGNVERRVPCEGFPVAGAQMKSPRPR